MTSDDLGFDAKGERYVLSKVPLGRETPRTIVCRYAGPQGDVILMLSENSESPLQQFDDPVSVTARRTTGGLSIDVGGTRSVDQVVVDRVADAVYDRIAGE